jgi:hypothetical protein
MVRPRREPQWGWPPKGRASGFVNPKPWTRRGTDSFLEQVIARGGKSSLLEISHGLDPDG